MKRFRFRLDRLVRLRGYRERLAKRDLATAMAHVSSLRGHLTMLEQNLSECQVEMGSAAALARGLERGLATAKARVSTRLATAEELAESKRLIYSDCRRDFKALDNLREQRFAEWQAAALAEEQSEMEEVARMRRHQRQHMGDK